MRGRLSYHRLIRPDAARFCSAFSLQHPRLVLVLLLLLPPAALCFSTIPARSSHPEHAHPSPMTAMDTPIPTQQKRPRVSEENRKRAVRAYVSLSHLLSMYLPRCLDATAVDGSKKNARVVFPVDAASDIVDNASSPTPIMGRKLVLRRHRKFLVTRMHGAQCTYFIDTLNAPPASVGKTWQRPSGFVTWNASWSIMCPTPPSIFSRCAGSQRS